MAVVYFDASALVKLLVDEDGTDLAVELWDTCHAAVSSRLSYPEVCAALAAAARAGRIAPRARVAIEREWETYWSAVRSIELTARVARVAGDLCRQHGLRGADGVHLASAMELVDVDPVMAVWDVRLSAAASAAGVRVAPSHLR